MAVDESVQNRVESAVCATCGSNVAPQDRVIDLDGQTYCHRCFAQQESLVELHFDQENQGRPDEALHQCSVCKRSLPAGQVYDSDGVIVCTECWERARPATSETQPEAPRPPRPKPPARAPLLARVACPHCWHKFAPQEILWVSRHAELMGDPVAGPQASLRFLPSRFSADGLARDARGMVCQSLACPNCHLVIPRPLVEIEPLFISIVGGPSSGKSCFLSAMTWELRRQLSLHFGVSFNDAEPSFNRVLNEEEETLFLPADPQRPVKLNKTDTGGAVSYDEIHLGQQTHLLPRPFLFTMRPSGKHPNADYASHLARVVCLYDNAGEHFMPGQADGISSVTQHLGFSRAILFLFDPTQDPRFRARLRGHSKDPQLDEQSPTRRQETILAETAARVRQFAGLSSAEPINRPLLVVVPKADVWGALINLDLSTEPIVHSCIANGTLAGVDLDRIEGVSNLVREMMLEIAPELVAAAEEFSKKVVYIPTSALGNSPEMISGREGLWIRPSQIKPKWVTAPFLYMFARWTHDLIARVRWQKNG